MENFNYLKMQIREYIYEAHTPPESRPDSDIDSEIVNRSDFEKQPLRNLFQKLNTFPDQSMQNSVLASIAKNEKTDGLIKLILFSWYLLTCVVITRVETDEEKYAFDIFDALNTTGQPLTALETLKPFVIQWQNQFGNYAGSFSEEQFERIEKDLNDQFPETEPRQKETKNLLVSFALYYEGRKQGLDLGAQRTFLRSGFSAAQNSEAKARQFVQSIADVAEFRRFYWRKSGIQNLDVVHNGRPDWCDAIKLCTSLIADMNTSMAIPILARYWAQYKANGDEESFVSATKSLAAFVAIRRAVTGGTSGIDSDLRSIMKKLCITSSLTLLNNVELNQELLSFLSRGPINVTDKNSWVQGASETALGTYSRPLMSIYFVCRR